MGEIFIILGLILSGCRFEVYLPIVDSYGQLFVSVLSVNTMWMSMNKFTAKETLSVRSRRKRLLVIYTNCVL